MSVRRILSAIAVISALGLPSPALGDRAYITLAKSGLPDPYNLLWELDVDTGGYREIARYPVQYAMALEASTADGCLYAAAWFPNPGFFRVNTTTGDMSPAWGPANVSNMAFAPDGYLYVHNGSSCRLTRYDLVGEIMEEYGVAAPDPFMLCGLAIDSAGQAIGLTELAPYLWSLDLATGTFSGIGPVSGLSGAGVYALDYTPRDELVALTRSGLYVIDVGSLAASPLCPLDNDDLEPGGLAIIPEPATLAMLALGGLAVLRRRKRQTRLAVRIRTSWGAGALVAGKSRLQEGIER